MQEGNERLLTIERCSSKIIELDFPGYQIVTRQYNVSFSHTRLWTLKKQDLLVAKGLNRLQSSVRYFLLPKGPGIYFSWPCAPGARRKPFNRAQTRTMAVIPTMAISRPMQECEAIPHMGYLSTGRSRTTSLGCGKATGSRNAAVCGRNVCLVRGRMDDEGR